MIMLELYDTHLISVMKDFYHANFSGRKSLINNFIVFLFLQCILQGKMIYLEKICVATKLLENPVVTYEP